MFHNLRFGIKAKLIGGFVVVAMITVIVGITGYWGISNVSGSVYEIGEIRLPSIQSLQEIEINAEELVVAQANLLNLNWV